MLDSSRRLRMDEPKLSISPYGLRGRIGSEAAPIAVDCRRSADLDDKLVAPPPDRVEPPAGPLRENSLIVYCNSEQEVRKGFAIALRAMGVEANFLPADIAPPTASSNREDN
jgi:hypothetical protein